MLALSRKRDESVAIGENGEIVVTVVEIRGDKVRLGIEADRSMSVVRGNSPRGRNQMGGSEEGKAA